LVNLSISAACRWTALLLAACGIALLWGCRKQSSGENETKGTTAAEVTVTRVQQGPLSENLLVSGNLAALPNQDAKIGALVAGRIERVLVKEGDRVAAGQELAQLENAPLRDQVRQAEAAVSQARANAENARISAERNQRLLERGIAARKEVEDTKTQLAVNEATLKQNEAALSAARAQVARTTIRAPFAGTVVRRFLGIGDQVDGTGAQPVVEVANIDALELLASVPGTRLNQVRTNDSFDFETPAVPGAKFSARVAAVLPAVDPATNNGTVRIRFDNPQHLLKLGMFLTVNLPLKAAANTLFVARQAIYPDENGEPHVYKVTGDQAESVPVKLGAASSDKVEILEGVQAGEVVVLNGGYGLPEKSKVRVKQ
jgi:RND family efflux transporter MFP subunit